MDVDDDWLPDPACRDTIMMKVVVRFTDTQIKKDLEAHANDIYDPVHVFKYATEHASDDEDEEDLDPEYLSKEEKDRMKKQQLEEQVYFDPLADDIDERWIEQKMKPGGSPVLSCPLCFIQLCYDSQRHDVYHNQHRAMFVKNCKVDCNTVVKPQGERNALDIFLAVNCAQCGTQVAVFEVATKLYHLFNVVTGFG